MTTKDEIVISRKDEQAFLERSSEKEAAKVVFETAMNRYHNTLVELREAEAKWWEHLEETYDLDLQNKQYEAGWDANIRRVIIRKKQK